MHRPIRLLCAHVALIAATAGCPGTLEDPERFQDASHGEAAPPGEAPGGEGGALLDASNCPDVPQTVFLTNCTAAGCHNSKDKTQGLDLQSPGVGARLVGAPATEGPGLIIDPSSPPSSVLYTKLTATPPFGARMPLGSKLDDPTTACVLAWITEQATASGNNNGAPDASGGSDVVQPETGP
jgi:hypothetical protein